MQTQNSYLVENNVISAPTPSENTYTQIVGNEEPLVVAKRLATSVQETYYDIGCILYNMKEFDLYQSVNPELYDKPNHGGWKDFCNNELAGIKHRTAEYWLNIYRYFREMNVSKETLTSMGWSKAKELIDLCDSDKDLEKAMKFAETHTLEEVKAYVEQYTARPGEDIRDVIINKKFTFALQDEVAKTAEEILARAAKQTDGDMNSAFFMMLLHWSFANPENPREEVYLNIEEIDETTI